MSRPSHIILFVLLFLRALIAFLIVAPPIVGVYLAVKFQFGPFLTLSIFSVAGVFLWLTQNFIDDFEGLKWKARIFRIGVAE